MPDLKGIMDVLEQILCEQRVTVVGGTPPLAVDDPASIVSGTPFVRLDAGVDSFRGRRRRVTIRREGRWVTLLTRFRPSPPEPPVGWLDVQHGRDSADRRVAVCATDGSSCTVHMLVDLVHASVVGASDGVDPVELLVEIFIGEPLSILLRQAPEPRVGAEVGRRVRGLLEKNPLDARAAFESELSRLGFASTRPLPEVLARRVRSLSRALAGPKRVIGDRRVDREVNRVVKLVRSRAVAAIRMGSTRIEGLMNPGPYADEWRLRAAMFRLQLGFSPFHPILQTWPPDRPCPGGRMGHCLGDAQPVLHAQDDDGDLYCLIDTVINFRETNRLRAVRVARTGLPLSDALASMF